MKIPQALIDSLQNIKGFDQEAFVQAHEQGKIPTSIRLNPFKISVKWSVGTQTKESETDNISWCENGRYVENPPKFNADPLFYAGTYTLQEANSMSLEYVLRQTVDLSKDLRILDLCASPSGKNTHIVSLITPESILVSNEVISTRSDILADNMTKFGTMNTIVTSNDPKDFGQLKGFFDVVVIDPPNSGSGLFRKNPEAIKDWSLENIELFAQRQKRIIADAWACLKEGGILIYSTSSYSPAENEEVMDWVCEKFGATVITSLPRSLSSKRGGAFVRITPPLLEERELGRQPLLGEVNLRFYPSNQGEGFFISALKKNNPEKETYVRSGRPIKNNSRRTQREVFRPWIKDIDNYNWYDVKDEFFLINSEHEYLVKVLESYLHIRKAGIKMGKIAGKDLIPDHQLAQSLYLTDNINRVELTEEDAMKYLRREDFSLDEAQKGWSLMTFQNFGLGWAKILPNRINNYYPKELRRA
jgi:16S rRNA C967 or C1407 C5-methylase (RsmB/RsmF family)/NOL1/NOP2/fmu family ribosome biogenesis protein